MLTVTDIIARLGLFELPIEGMDNSTQHIKKVARLINKKYNKYAVPPIYAERIVQEEGLSLMYRNLASPFVSAFNRKEKVIVLTDNKELLRKWGNFALAHALGHWYLHSNETDYFSIETIQNTREQDDRDANLFASFLLMPDKLLQEWQWLPKQLFSSAFNVPMEVIAFRLKDL